MVVPTRLLVDGQLSSPFRSSKKQRFALPGLVKLQTNFDHRKAISKSFCRYMHGGPQSINLPGEMCCCASPQSSKLCKKRNMAWLGSSVPEQTWYEEKNYEVFFSTSEDLSFHGIFLFSPQSEHLARKKLFMKLSVCHCENV